MRAARIETFKYPHQPRYFYPTQVVEDSSERLICYSSPGVAVYIGKEDKTVLSVNHSLNILWPGRYYNVVLFWKENWVFDCYYVNLAMPHDWDGELCVYIDLELDVAMFNDGTIQILDEDEYEEGKIKYNYPQELIAQIEQATKEVVAMMEARTYPFDGSLVNWRP